MTYTKQNDITFDDRIAIAVLLVTLTFLTSIIVTLLPCIAIPHFAGAVLPIIARKWYWITIILLSLVTGVVGFILKSYHKGQIAGVAQTSVDDTDANINPDDYELSDNVTNETRDDSFMCDPKT